MTEINKGFRADLAIAEDVSGNHGDFTQIMIC